MTFYRGNGSVNYSSIAELCIYDANDVNIARQIGCVYSASSTSENTPASAFDGSTSTHWHSDSNGAPHWLQVRLPSEATVVKYSICPRDYYSGSYVDRPVSFKLQGSNNGYTWVTLDTQENLTTGWAAHTYRDFTVNYVEPSFLPTIPLEYISSSIAGAQYIDTCVDIAPSHTLEIKARINEVPTYTNYDTIFGTRKGNNKRFTLRYNGSTNGELCAQKCPNGTAGYQEYTSSIRKNGEGLNWHVFKMDASSYYEDGVLKCTFSTGNNDLFNSLYLCALNNNFASAADRAAIDIAYCKIWDANNNLLRNFIPVLGENNEPCLYDTVSQLCFYSGSNAPFIAGPISVSQSYLIESQGTYYTIQNGSLLNIGSTLSSGLFATYGLVDIPAWSDISSLTNPSILAWGDLQSVPLLATTEGVPLYPQIVYTQNVDMTHPTITGIDSVDIVSDDSTPFAMSFDNGSTWWNYLNSQWVQLTTSTAGQVRSTVEDIPTSAWAEKATTGHIKFRFILSDETAYVTSIRINYTN